MKKILTIITITMFGLTTLTSCSSYAEDTSPAEKPVAVEVGDESSYAPEHTSVISKKLPDGREVICIWASGFKKGGLSCDWDNAKKPDSFE